MPPYVPLEQRFWTKADQSGGLFACWPWLGALSVHGSYAVIRADGKAKRAARVAYELANGPIPAGLHIDHLCRNTTCVNPAHLEAVTQKENNRRQFAAITQCPQGHPYPAEGRRRCHICTRERHPEYMRRYRERKRLGLV